MTGELEVRFTEATPNHRPEQFAINATLDLSGDDWVVGIEILDVRAQLGGRQVHFPQCPDENVRWAYDEEVDAFGVAVGRHGAPIAVDHRPVTIEISRDDTVLAIRCIYTNRDAANSPYR